MKLLHFGFILLLTPPFLTAGDILSCLYTSLSNQVARYTSNENLAAYEQLKNYISNDNTIFMKEESYGSADKDFAEQARLVLRCEDSRSKYKICQSISTREL
ncbi:MAG: hypothetical protein A2504_12065 [Bdellovibrionales bacterium RIFOXYD12_FULL_39_22]|nr:MAG: hypothetical protein A2385_16580 [Bdellovibrionales bacterium RIFOXYB1_FULL_39_21]OFZ44428.1 MAG: hypothetical protein A2485_06315 [Bdellovibrionales bacterium RIFOXYC12_FULL_39_17]OFZ49930.1 MAG: hypothetical protein A2404_01150 [Bdellovibrionales bacterium RIFOXYC1_FULL_39_130]OFZ68519.1 MAG: hypothetical protein A2451_01895 [Bdellovibrionales bacterium RIFOXYC2_FULL_39_8]OFZ76935.1 MAG: hypothetical protein A2560_05950 [Bdellovibrionales bacterium RIFOXYD1_FULL_39_84]OFZ95862.1 MAG: